MHKQSFFEYLGISHAERIHSQFFAWLFSKDCDALTHAQKDNLAISLFGLDANTHIENVATEVSGIDILIKTSTGLIVIENKLKSSQHSNQLYRYKEYCDQNYPADNKKFYYLTLAGEPSGDLIWISMSYKKMYDGLKILKLNKQSNHSVIIDEYLIFLHKLTAVVDDFLANTKEYDMVFNDGGRKKFDKINFPYKTQNERFIASNQLETILQKCYLGQVSKNISTNIGLVSETRGDALIDFVIKSNIVYKKRKFDIILQLQKDSIKFAFTIYGRNYSTSNKSWVLDAEHIIRKLARENSFGYKRVNLPKTRAYIAVSKKLEVNYWKISIEDLTSFLSTELDNAMAMADFLIKEFENDAAKSLSQSSEMSHVSAT